MKTNFLSNDAIHATSVTGKSKIIGIAYNYPGVGQHNDNDCFEPLCFLKGLVEYSVRMKPNIRLPKYLMPDRVWVEVELAAVIGEKIYQVTEVEALAAIESVVIANDITASNILGRDHHLLRSKGLPGFTFLGSNFSSDILLYEDKSCHLEINGRIFQRDNLKNRFLNTAQCVSLASLMVPLFPGDIVLTGTPPNAMNCVVKVGDEVSFAIAGLEEVRLNVTE